jgi:dihydrofolate reductase
MYEQPSWLLTHRPHIVAEGHPVQVFDGDVADLHPKLVSAAAGKDVWVVGGGETAAQFSSAGLIDEIIVTYAPCSLGPSSRLLPIRSEWALVESGSTATSSAPGGGCLAGRRYPVAAHELS